jgi:hypothetical protein
MDRPVIENGQSLDLWPSYSKLKMSKLGLRKGFVAGGGSKNCPGCRMWHNKRLRILLYNSSLSRYKTGSASINYLTKIIGS